MLGETVGDDVRVFELNNGKMELPWTGGGGEWGWRKCVGIVSDM